MKSLFLSLLAVLALSGAAVADNANDVKVLQTPKLPDEKLKQVLFAWKFDPNYQGTPLLVSLHNPFRDLRLRGIVVTVQSKMADAQAQTIEVFIDLECGPLQSSDSQVRFFKSDEVAKLSPMVVLKEVHYAE